MSGTWNAFTGDVSSFYNRDIAPAVSDVGNFLSNPTNDLELGGGLLGAFLLPELLPGLASLFTAAPAAAASADALGSLGATGASALGFAGDVGGGAADTGALAGIDSALANSVPAGSTLLTGAAGGPLLTVTPDVAATAGPALDLGGAASDPLDILAAGGIGAGAGAAGIGGAGAGLGDLLGASALASNLGSSLGSGAGSIPGVSVPSAAPAATGASTAAGGGPPSLAAGGAPSAAGGLGGAAGGAGAGAAANAAPGAPGNVTSSDALAFSGAPASGSPNIPGFPSYSPSGQPLSAAATDPTAIGGTGTSGGFDALYPGGALGPGVTLNSGPLGDAAPISLGGIGSSIESGLGSAWNWIKANPLMAAALGLGGGELLKNLISPPKLPYQQQQEQIASTAQANAGQLNQEGQTDLSYETSGTLPPGLQAQVTQALNDAIASSNSKYASLGLGNSTMAQQEQQYLTLQSRALAGQLQQQLAQTGTQLISDATSDLSVAEQVYSALMQTQISQDTALETSVSQFAGSLALASVLGSKGGIKPTTA